MSSLPQRSTALIDERVLHVHQHADRRIDARELLDGEHRVEEAAARAAVASPGISIPMTPRSNSLSMSVRGNLGVLVHLAHERADLRVGEVADAVAEDDLVFGQHGERLGVF